MGRQRKSADVLSLYFLIVSCVFLINKQLNGIVCFWCTILPYPQSQNMENIWKNTFIHRTDTIEL